jgi:hypothetical protein
MRYIYNPSTGTLSPSPRSDGLPVVGLAAGLVELLEVVQEPPEHHDPATHYLVPTQEIDVAASTVTRGWAVEPLPEPEIEPQWVAFGAAVMGDVGINQMLGAALQAAPALYGGLVVGLGDAAKGDPKVFLGHAGAPGAWQIATALSLVTPELAEAVAVMATAHHLPADFIHALNPVPQPE